MSGRRLRTRATRNAANEISSSPPMPPSSPPASSPPVIPDLDDDDIVEDNEIIDDDVDVIRNLDDAEELAEEEAGIDLFGDTYGRDYRHVDDTNYEAEGIDDEGEYEELDPETRRRIDAQLNRRDRELNQRRRGMPAAFQDDEDEEMDGTFFDPSAASRRRRHRYDEEQIEVDLMTDLMNDELSLEALQEVKAGNVTEWVSQPAVHATIAREFKSFLTEYTDEHGISVYGTRIRTLGEVNAESLEVSFEHLAEAKATLAYFLANAPAEILKIFDEVAMEVTLLHYPDYERIRSEIHVRITDLPVRYTLRQLRQSHLNCLVRVSGVITRRTGVFPQLKYVKFDCTHCGVTLGPFQQESNAEVKLSYCQNCQKRGPFTVNSEKTVYRNYQKVTIQETPGTVPAGRLPRHREVILLWDLIDTIKPGEEVEITAVYRNNFDSSLNTSNGFPVFSTVLEANHVLKVHDELAGFLVTQEDEDKIVALSKDPQIVDRIIASIAPNIWGHTDIKTAVALSLFGGVSKEAQGKHAIRGDINVLLLGDPGTAKSQVLKYVEKTAHRAVFATGQGASAVGLTASVRRDPLTSEWTLEGGALVLADRGTCLIDEFDKMNDQDRTSIHEAMEQQTISLSKAGIVTSLKARCAIVAAANPIGGKYNATIPFSQNVELTEPILSRFDILCVVRDTVEPAEDEQLARFVIDSHSRSAAAMAAKAGGASAPGASAGPDPFPNHIDSDPNVAAAASGPSAPPTPSADPATTSAFLIPQPLLRKYILYARQRCRPRLYQIDQDKIARLFADMRRESLSTGAYPITVRHLEAIIRIAEAFCKMRLSEYCSNGDIDRAIKVAIGSFVGSQKVSAKRALGRAFSRYLLGTFGGKAGGGGGGAGHSGGAARTRGGMGAVGAY